MVLVRRIARGARAGALATVLMSGVLFAAKRMGILPKLPPERIVEKLFDATGIRRSEPRENAAATAAHIGFGAAAGALYELLSPGPVRPLLRGPVYGLLVWAASYGGWIPAAGILPRPKHDRPGRQATMVIAHVVYGAALGAISAYLRMKGLWARSRPMVLSAP